MVRLHEREVAVYALIDGTRLLTQQLCHAVVAEAGTDQQQQDESRAQHAHYEHRDDVEVVQVTLMITRGWRGRRIKRQITRKAKHRL